MLESKVLVVDDNRINRKVFRNLLKRYEINVYEAEGGEECLEMLQQHKFDIIFLDYMMPGMDGIETLHKIKSDKLCEDTPIVMLTANAAVGMNGEYISEGFDAYLSKPIEVEELDKVVLKYLSKEYADRIEHSKEHVQADSVKKLPHIEEFDFDYAMNILKSEDILLKTLEDFFYFLKNLPEKLSTLYDDITQDETRVLYKIEVHALKSTAATVGALVLSRTAEMLEVAAETNCVERIVALHPILLEEIDKHRERVSSVLTKTEDEVEYKTLKEILPYFDMLRRSLDNNDYSAADVICNEIKKYKYPIDVQDLINEIMEHVMNLEADDALNSIAKLKMEGEV